MEAAWAVLWAAAPLLAPWLGPAVVEDDAPFKAGSPPPTGRNPPLVTATPRHADLTKHYWSVSWRVASSDLEVTPSLG